MSRIKQFFDPEIETVLNKQIQTELCASYIYQAMYTFFSRSDISLLNIANFFKNAYEEERSHADMFINYIIKRGGTVNLLDVPKPTEYLDRLYKSKNSLLDAFEMAFRAEMEVNLKIHDIVSIANDKKDHQLIEFIGPYLNEQIDSIYEIDSICTEIKRIGLDGHTIWLFDKEFNKRNLCKCKFV